MINQWVVDLNFQTALLQACQQLKLDAEPIYFLESKFFVYCLYG